MDKYKLLFRIDDVCDKMKNEKMFYELVDLLNKYNVKPLVGVIPKVEDNSIIHYNSNFKLEDLKELIKENKIEVAIHGFNHKYITKKFGISGRDFKPNSEFVGLPYKEQRNKIENAIKIIKERLNIKPRYFFAPNHSYDETTLKVLKEFNLINCDGISLFPFEYKGVFYIPQQTGSFYEKFSWPIKIGVFAYHFHPQTTNRAILKKLELFLEGNKKYLGNYEEIVKNKDFYLKLNERYTILNKIFRIYFKLKRRLYINYKLIYKISFPYRKINEISKELNINYLTASRIFLVGFYKYVKNSIIVNKYNLDNWHKLPKEWLLFRYVVSKKIIEIIKNINKKEINVVDIGCGLGELSLFNILENKQSLDKKVILYLFDIDKNFESFYKELYKKISDNKIKFNFFVGSFKDVQKLKIKDIDILITFDFLHGLDENFIKEHYGDLIKHKKVQYIILDQRSNFNFVNFFKNLKYDLIFKKEFGELELLIFKYKGCE